MVHRDAQERSLLRVKRRRLITDGLRIFHVLAAGNAYILLTLFMIPVVLMSFWGGFCLAQEVDAAETLFIVIVCLTAMVGSATGLLSGRWVVRRLLKPINKSVESAKKKEIDALTQLDDIEARVADSPKDVGADAGLSFASDGGDDGGGLSVVEEDGALSLDKNDE